MCRRKHVLLRQLPSDSDGAHSCEPAAKQTAPRPYSYATSADSMSMH